MNGKDIVIGIAFLSGAYLLHHIRKWDYYKGECNRLINSMKDIKHWMVIGMCLVVGLVYIFKAFSG